MLKQRRAALEESLLLLRSLLLVLLLAGLASGAAQTKSKTASQQAHSKTKTETETFTLTISLSSSVGVSTTTSCTAATKRVSSSTSASVTLSRPSATSSVSIGHGSLSMSIVEDPTTSRTTSETATASDTRLSDTMLPSSTSSQTQTLSNTWEGTRSAVSLSAVPTITTSRSDGSPDRTLSASSSISVSDTGSYSESATRSLSLLSAQMTDTATYSSFQSASSSHGHRSLTRNSSTFSLTTSRAVHRSATLSPTFSLQFGSLTRTVSASHAATGTPITKIPSRESLPLTSSRSSSSSTSANSSISESVPQTRSKSGASSPRSLSNTWTMTLSNDGLTPSHSKSRSWSVGGRTESLSKRGTRASQADSSSGSMSKSLNSVSDELTKSLSSSWSLEISQTRSGASISRSYTRVSSRSWTVTNDVTGTPGSHTDSGTTTISMTLTLSETAEHPSITASFQRVFTKSKTRSQEASVSRTKPSFTQASSLSWSILLTPTLSLSHSTSLSHRSATEHKSETTTYTASGGEATASISVSSSMSRLTQSVSGTTRAKAVDGMTFSLSGLSHLRSSTETASDNFTQSLALSISTTQTPSKSETLSIGTMTLSQTELETMSDSRGNISASPSFSESDMVSYSASVSVSRTHSQASASRNISTTMTASSSREQPTSSATRSRRTWSEEPSRSSTVSVSRSRGSSTASFFNFTKSRSVALSESKTMSLTSKSGRRSEVHSRSASLTNSLVIMSISLTRHRTATQVHSRTLTITLSALTTSRTPILTKTATRAFFQPGAASELSPFARFQAETSPCSLILVYLLVPIGIVLLAESGICAAAMWYHYPVDSDTHKNVAAWRSLMSLLVYVSCIVPCHYRCAWIHTLNLLVHLSSMTFFLSLLVNQFADISAGPHQRTIVIAVALVLTQLTKPFFDVAFFYFTVREDDDDMDIGPIVIVDEVLDEDCGEDEEGAGGYFTGGNQQAAIWANDASPERTDQIREADDGDEGDATAPRVAGKSAFMSAVGGGDIIELDFDIDEDGDDVNNQKQEARDADAEVPRDSRPGHAAAPVAEELQFGFDLSAVGGRSHEDDNSDDGERHGKKKKKKKKVLIEGEGGQDGIAEDDFRALDDLVLHHDRHETFGNMPRPHPAPPRTDEGVFSALSRWLLKLVSAPDEKQRGASPATSVISVDFDPEEFQAVIMPGGGEQEDPEIVVVSDPRTLLTSQFPATCVAIAVLICQIFYIVRSFSNGRGCLGSGDFFTWWCIVFALDFSVGEILHVAFVATFRFVRGTTEEAAAGGDGKHVARRIHWLDGHQLHPYDLESRER